MVGDLQNDLISLFACGIDTGDLASAFLLPPPFLFLKDKLDKFNWTDTTLEYPEVHLSLFFFFFTLASETISRETE